MKIHDARLFLYIASSSSVNADIFCFAISLLSVTGNNLPSSEDREFPFDKGAVNATITINQIKKSCLYISGGQLIEEADYLTSSIGNAHLIDKDIKALPVLLLSPPITDIILPRYRVRTIKFTCFKFALVNPCLVEHLLYIAEGYDIINCPGHLLGAHFSHVRKTWSYIDNLPAIPFDLPGNFTHCDHRRNNRRKVGNKLREIFLNIRDDDRAKG